ncbi:hypothetical protein [Bradyrhizobium sp.]|uniref:hypothetical protein n=1 Tax=Bradyrhizobium sp. TaxID=376 RepID=UPI0039E28F54
MQKTVLGEQSQSVTLEAGYTLKISAASEWTSGRLRLPEIRTLTGKGVWNIPLGSSKTFGPFPTVRRYTLDALGAGGKISYEIYKAPYDIATQVGNIESFSASFALQNEDNGKVFRCDSASNVTVAVPADLMEGFNVGFVQWDAGTITLASEPGATKRAGGSATSSQFQSGSLIVLKNTDGASAEFKVGGDFA